MARGQDFSRSPETMVPETNERSAPRLVGYLAYTESVLAGGAVGSGLAFFAVYYCTRTFQPWGTISDLFGVLLALVLLPLLLEIRRVPTVQERPTARMALSLQAS